MRKEFSADEIGILEAAIAFVLVLQFVFVCSLYVAKELAELNFLHITYKLYFSSLLFYDLSVIFLLAAYAHISNTGYEIRPVENICKYFERHGNIITTLTFSLHSKCHFLNNIHHVVATFGKGIYGYSWTLSRNSPSCYCYDCHSFNFPLCGVILLSNFCKLILFALLLKFLPFIFKVFDPASVLYLYQSPGGYGICAVRIFVWLYFAYACFRTIHHHKSKAEFYYTFFSIYTIW